MGKKQTFDYKVRYGAGGCNSFSVRAGMCKRGDMCLVFATEEMTS